MSTETRDFTKSEAITWIYRNNLGRIFPSYLKGNFTHFVSKVPISGLTLPDGWYYIAEENIFTNKNNSSTRDYDSIDVIYRE